MLGPSLRRAHPTLAAGAPTARRPRLGGGRGRRQTCRRLASLPARGSTCVEPATTGRLSAAPQPPYMNPLGPSTRPRLANATVTSGPGLRRSCGRAHCSRVSRLCAGGRERGSTCVCRFSLGPRLVLQAASIRTLTPPTCRTWAPRPGAGSPWEPVALTHTSRTAGHDAGGLDWARLSRRAPGPPRLLARISDIAPHRLATAVVYCGTKALAPPPPPKCDCVRGRNAHGLRACNHSVASSLASKMYTRSQAP